MQVTDALIRIQDISKVFKKRDGFISYFTKTDTCIALDRVNLEINSGELFCLVGHNGAGKTTLVKILCSLILPDDGRAYINGIDIIENTEIRKRIGLVIANERSFYGRITGRQNLEFFGALFNLFGKELQDRIKELANLLEIESVLDTRFLYYSTGIQQRFNIARALLHNPDILFLDNPTRDIDIPTRNKILKFIKVVLNKKEKKTIVFVTHQPDEIKDVCDRLCILDRGRVSIVATIEELKEKTGLSDMSSILNYYIKKDT